MPHPTASLLYISRTVWARITKFYADMHTNMPYICTRCDVTNYLRSEVITKKPSTMPPQMASVGISQERFKRGSPNFTRLLGTTGSINLPDMTSLVASGRLQNAIKYCTKVVERPVGQRVQGHHHNGDLAARWPHIFCSICIHSFGDLAKDVWLFIASFHNQPMFCLPPPIGEKNTQFSDFSCWFKDQISMGSFLWLDILAANVVVCSCRLISAETPLTRWRFRLFRSLCVSSVTLCIRGFTVQDRPMLCIEVE